MATCSLWDCYQYVLNVFSLFRIIALWWEVNLKSIDAKKHLWQIKYLPDVTPLCGILMILLMLFFVRTTWHGYHIGDLPEAKYAHYEPFKYESIPTIGIRKNGDVYFMDSKLVELNRLPTLIFDYMEETQCKDNKKVLFEVAIDTSWSRVRDVMDALKNSQIEVVGFVTEKSATTLDYYHIQNIYHENKLLVPDSAK